MKLKLALRNVRRCARDYAIYFATVMVGVAIFYAFNAVSSQTVLLDALSAESQRVIGLLSTFMRVFSIVVACVLGFLVVYANRFLVRRRKREFGTYLMLGMKPSDVSVILACEAFVVGAAALAVGLALGIAASQGLSFATAALMGATMTKYRFIVSGQAVAFTALCFAAIFIVSAIVDVVYVRKSKLSSLLSSHQGSEQVKVVPMPLSIFVFLASLAIIGCAYWQLKVNGLQQIDIHFISATALMIVGTFAFFWSATGFVLALARRNKSLYLKGTAAFTLRQISSKVNTAFASMGVVCVLLFFAVTAACTGIGLYDLFVGNMKETTQFDMSLRADPYAIDEEGDEENRRLFDAYGGDIEACLSAIVPNWIDFADSSAQIDYYAAETTYSALVDQVPNASNLIDASSLVYINRTPLALIPVSQYNATCTLVGAPRLTLNDGECSILNTTASSEDLAQAFADAGLSFDVGGSILHFVGPVQHQAIRNSAVKDSSLLIIVPDSAVEGKRPLTSWLNVMYACDRPEGDKAFAQGMAEAFPLDEPILDDEGNPIMEYQYAMGPWPVWATYSGAEMADQATGLGMVVTYLAIYIGLVLLIATAAVLAVQQLSETADSLGRYRRLSTVGCPQKAVFGSLRRQTLVYFLAPLLLAFCHAACATAVLNAALFAELGVSVARGILVAALMVALVYGAYLLISLRLSKSMVKQVLV